MTELYNDNGFSRVYPERSSSSEAGLPPDSHERTQKRISDVLDEVETILRTRYELSTRRVYLSRLNQLKLFLTDVLGEASLAAPCTALNGIANDFLKHMQSERAITSYTYNNYVSFLSLVAIVAGQQLHGIQRNYETSEAKQGRAASNFLSDSEVEACLQAAKTKGCKRTELLLSLLLHTGLSLRGCLNLKIEDFVIESDKVVVLVSSKQMSRAIDVPSEVGTLLQEWLIQRANEGIEPDNQLVFPGRTGSLSNTAAEWSLRSIGWRLGLCLSPKVLRKTFRYHSLTSA